MMQSRVFQGIAFTAASAPAPARPFRLRSNASPRIAIQNNSPRCQASIRARSGKSDLTHEGGDVSSADSLDALDRELLALQSDDDSVQVQEESQQPLQLDELLVEYFEEEKERSLKRQAALDSLEKSGVKFLPLLAVVLIVGTLTTNIVYIYLLKLTASG